MSSELDALQYYGLGDSVKPIEKTLVTATTIAPTTQITYITGTTQIATITPPWSGFAGSLDFIFASAQTTLTTGNIAIATTVVAKQTLRMTYSVVQGKWYPSY